MRSELWKDVTLPTLHEWQGVQHYSFNTAGQILIEPDETGKISVDFSPMRPNTLTRLIMTASIETTEGKTANLTFSEQQQILESGKQQIILESNLILDPVLTITGISSIKIISLQVQICFPDRSNPVPYDLIGMDLLTPNIAPGFIIGKSRIGQEPLGKLQPTFGAFIIGESRIDETHLPIILPPYSWKDILGPGLSLSFRVGANKGSTLLPVAQAGSAIIEIKDLDPRQTILRVGLKCRIYHRLTRRTLFTGTLKSFSMEPAKWPKQHDIATLEFADNVARLAGIKRYGVRTNAPDALEARLEKLLSGTGLKWKILEGETPVANALGATVMESNLAEYLDMTCATIGGAWWVTPDGQIVINPNNEVRIWRNQPWFIIGQTPLDAGKLAAQGIELLKASEITQVDTPFIIGRSKLDTAMVGVSPINQGFVIGQSRLDDATLQDYATNTAWALRKPMTPPLFTDRYNTDRSSLYYIDIETGFDSGEILTEVAVENHSASKENGSWQDATTTYKAHDAANAAIYGQSSKTVKANASTPANAQALAKYLLNRPKLTDLTVLQVTSVKMNALIKSEDLARLELFDYCQVKFKDETTDQQIYAFENRLTPFTWKERLYLTQAKERIVMA